MAESKIVQAVGIASGLHIPGQEKSPLNKKLEAAMTKAVEDAIAEGLSLNDVAEVNRRIHEAKDRVLAQDAFEWISGKAPE